MNHQYNLLKNQEIQRIESAPPLATCVIRYQETNKFENNNYNNKSLCTSLKTLSINIHTDGLRACFLYRFLEEMLIFISLKLIDPMTLCIQKAIKKIEHINKNTKNTE